MSAVRHLHVRVLRNGEEHVRLTLPASAAARLTHLMPPHVADDAKASGVDLAELERQAAEGDLSPRVLVDCRTSDGKQVTLWLE